MRTTHENARPRQGWKGFGALIAFVCALLPLQAGMAAPSSGLESSACRDAIFSRTDSPQILLDHIRTVNTDATIDVIAINEAYGTPLHPWVGKIVVGIDRGQTFALFTSVAHSEAITLGILSIANGTHALHIQMIDRSGKVNGSINACISIPSRSTIRLKDLTRNLST